MTTTIERGISLRELNTEWERLGGSIVHLRRTQEAQYQAPDGTWSTKFSHHRKDAPLTLIAFVRRYLRSLSVIQSANLLEQKTEDTVMAKAQLPKPLPKIVPPNGTTSSLLHVNAAMPGKMTAAVEMVTPAMAERWLSTMDHNRPTRNHKIDQFAREMIGQRWELNAETIKFGLDAKLMDGFHRLSAVVLSQCTVPMLVVRGLPASAMPTIDTGTPRNYADVVSLRTGNWAGFNLASVARLWWQYENAPGSTKKALLSHQELDYIITTHPRIPEGSQRAASSHFRRHLPVSVMGFTYAWLAEHEDPEMAELFLSTLEKGANLNDDDPIFALRRRLFDTTGRRDARLLLALVIKAYNNWAAGTKIRVLALRSDEPYPQFGKPNADAASARVRRTRRLTQTSETPVVAAGTQ